MPPRRQPDIDYFAAFFIIMPRRCFALLMTALHMRSACGALRYFDIRAALQKRLFAAERTCRAMLRRAARKDAVTPRYRCDSYAFEKKRHESDTRDARDARLAPRERPVFTSYCYAYADDVMRAARVLTPFMFDAALLIMRYVCRDDAAAALHARRCV